MAIQFTAKWFGVIGAKVIGTIIAIMLSSSNRYYQLLRIAFFRADCIHYAVTKINPQRYVAAG